MSLEDRTSTEIQERRSKSGADDTPQTPPTKAREEFAQCGKDSFVSRTALSRIFQNLIFQISILMLWSSRFSAAAAIVKLPHRGCWEFGPRFGGDFERDLEEHHCSVS
ncbi:Uncharacterized protein Fot_15926 [Forsythia ovata]|uniref:Uncharacterized protein n=1 Tax=Forsythia ovata TaxID=205694 RepID=A0ABD1WD87_9LAMI